MHSNHYTSTCDSVMMWPDLPLHDADTAAHAHTPGQVHDVISPTAMRKLLLQLDGRSFVARCCSEN